VDRFHISRFGDVESGKVRSVKLGSLQAGRGIAALSVVLLHTATYFSADYPGCLKYFHFGHYGVSFFFVLSGIVILLAHWKDVGQPKSWTSYAHKRWRRVYPIYWVVLALVMLHPNQHFPRAFLLVISSFTLFHIGSCDSILPVAWTLFCEVTFYAIFSFAILNRSLGIVAFATWFAGCIWFAFHLQSVNAYMLPVQVLFGFGMFVTLAFKRGWIRGEWVLLLIGSGILAWSVCDQPMAFDDVWSGIGCAFIIAALIGWERKEKFRVPRMLLFFGEASYSIYLIHIPVISLITRSVLSLRAPMPVLFVLEFAIASTAGILLHIGIERPLLARLSRVPILGREIPPPPKICNFDPSELLPSE
jgi:exopolysaccharide production protein ExoZ